MDTEETPMALLASALRSTTYEMADALGGETDTINNAGWTDGLPIVAPTRRAFLACLRAADLSPRRLVGIEPCGKRSITAEKVAITPSWRDACPLYLPVVVAILRAMCHEAL